jgi:hypothetical protein
LDAVRAMVAVDVCARADALRTRSDAFAVSDSNADDASRANCCQSSPNVGAALLFPLGVVLSLLSMCILNCD